VGTFGYIKNFVSDKYIASVTPTSIYGVRKVCGKIDFRRARTFVEFGPGMGVFTRYLLERIQPEAQMVLIERNRNFAGILRKRFTDPRVRVVNNNAENVLEILEECGVMPVDYILSGIPFSFFHEEARREIIKAIHRVLRDGGKFLAYQTFYQAPPHLRLPLEECFDSVRVEYEILNIPPLSIYEAVKNGRPAPR
jgi:phospholipid N-methyltransferase